MHNRSLSRELSLLSLGLIKDTGDLELNKIQIDEVDVDLYEYSIQFRVIVDGIVSNIHTNQHPLHQFVFYLVPNLLYL
jgi:hypothetical protein